MGYFVVRVLLLFTSVFSFASNNDSLELNPGTIETVTPANALNYKISGYCAAGGGDVEITFGTLNITEPCHPVLGIYNFEGDVSTEVITDPIRQCVTQGPFSSRCSVFVVNELVGLGPPPPTVSLASSVDINRANQFSYSASGFCSEEGEEVLVVVGGVSPLPQPICTSGAWSFTGLDVSVALDGVVSITADHQNTSGDSAVQANANVNKTTPILFLASSTQTVGDANLNLAPDDLEWSGLLIHPNTFEIDEVNQDVIRIKVAGDYKISFNLPITATGARTNILVQLKLNGTVVQGGVGASSYIRNASNHTESSDHISYIFSNLNVGDELEVQVEREGNAGAVSILGAAQISIEPILADKIFKATATQTLSGTNLNPSVSEFMSFSSSAVSSSFSHSNVLNPDQITFSDPGNYFVSSIIPYDSTLARVNVRSSLVLDGSIVEGSEARQGYIRAASGHNSASIHWQGFLESVTAGQVLQVSVGADARAGAVTNMVGQSSSLNIEKIESNEYIHLRATNVVAGTNWNTASFVNWTIQDSVDSTNFLHSTVTNSEEVMVLSDGEYFISYTDSLVSSSARANVRIKAQVNGMDVGLVCSTHYVRALNGHNESSCALSGLLPGLFAGDVISISTSQEGNGGVVTSNSDARFFILKK